MSEPVEVTKRGGRDATTRHIPPTLALAVGMPSTPAPNGWRWTALTKLARMESGHTPSRKHPEYWGGTIPWIGIQDAKSNHGRRIRDTVIRLGPFLTEYFRKRTDVKPSIKINWSHTRRNLLAFFGPDKPLAAVTVGDARDFERYLKGDSRQNRYADKEASDGLS